MKNLINPTPPVVRAITRDNHNDTINARILCLVDGYAAEVRHSVHTKRQDWNNHSISVFDPKKMEWETVIDWGYTELGHVPLPVHTDDETCAALTSMSELMWTAANLVVAQSRQRQTELDLQLYREKVLIEGELTRVTLVEDGEGRIADTVSTLEEFEAELEADLAAQKGDEA